jgi:predicted alpha/beta-hydrolase family hydrolase
MSNQDTTSRACYRRHVRPTVESPKGPVSVLTLPPGGSAQPVVVLAHGAGTDMYHRSLTALAEDLTRARLRVVRFNFPYREAGRRAPDRMPVLLETFGAVVDAVQADLKPPWIVLAGRSMGGRVASHLARERTDLRGLCFLSFPLHRAGTPSAERAAHLPEIRIPMLFVQGTRDALADWDSMRRVLATLPTATTHVVEHGDHSLAVPKRRADPEVVREGITRAITDWLATLA